jgi:3-deoxy-7-phosphoheptulonate synthase
MLEPLEDRNLTEIRPLPPPKKVKRTTPITPRAALTVATARREIRDIIHGRDATRLLAIVGPCSIHHPDEALEYATRLQCAAEPLRGEICVVMRTYFEKPRSNLGWKGLVNDPNLDESCDVAAGLALARRLLLEINQLGLPCASEMLDPFMPQFVADLLSWAAIGARTSESQPHRELASGLSMPIGFKNGTHGGLGVAHNAMITASRPHSFLGISVDGRSAVVSTTGNPDLHLVLRGGNNGPNHDAESIEQALARVAGLGVARPIMVDCSHGNSQKDHTRQAAVCHDILRQVLAGNGAIMGLMLESNLRPGNQPWSPGRPLRRGLSITDTCIGWNETEDLLNEIAAVVKLRR